MTRVIGCHSYYMHQSISGRGMNNRAMADLILDRHMRARPQTMGNGILAVGAHRAGGIKLRLRVPLGQQSISACN